MKNWPGVKKKPFYFSFWSISEIYVFLWKISLGTFFTTLNFEQMCHHQRSKKTFSIQFLIDKWNLCFFMEIFARTFFVGNRISNKRVTTSGRKASFKMRWNLWIFIKYLAEKFFVENWISSKPASSRDRKIPFNFSFWLISWKPCISMKIFARNFFVRNWILNKHAIAMGRKKLKLKQTCHHQGSKKLFRIQCLVDKKYMYI